jgi:hypothetical protein
MSSHNSPVPASPFTRSNASSSRHDSRVSVNTHGSIRSHQEYLDSLIPPTKEQSHHIEIVQERKEEEIIKKRLSVENGQAWQELSDEERTKAAGLIQRNYRGYRARRRMRGMGLDPSSRWIEAVKEARYRNLLTPKARSSYDGTGSEQNDVRGHANGGEEHKPSLAKQNWRKVVSIARRATGDEDSDVSTDDDDDNDLPEEEREERRQRRAEQKRERQKAARILDLQYVQRISSKPFDDISPD